jgi:hypothetical protein
LEITTDAGEIVSGYGMSLSADEAQVRAGDNIVKLGRKALSYVNMARSGGHQLRSLGRAIAPG